MRNEGLSDQKYLSGSCHSVNINKREVKSVCLVGRVKNNDVWEEMK